MEQSLNHVLKFRAKEDQKKEKRPYMGKCPEWDNDEKKLGNSVDELIQMISKNFLVLP